MFYAEVRMLKVTAYLSISIAEHIIRYPVPSFYVWSLIGHIRTPPCDIKREHRCPTSSVYNKENISLLTLNCMIILGRFVSLNDNVDNAREVWVIHVAVVCCTNNIRVILLALLSGVEDKEMRRWVLVF